MREANRLGLAVIGLVDTNCDPDEATYVIPGNDDAIRSCNLILGALADAIVEGKGALPNLASRRRARTTRVRRLEAGRRGRRGAGRRGAAGAGRRGAAGGRPAEEPPEPAAEEPAGGTAAPREAPSPPPRSPRPPPRSRPSRPRPRPTRGRGVSTTIPAKLVKDLRERTGAGMMDCKRALEEAGGDIEAAATALRTKGLADAAKRAGRAANEGLVDSYIHAGGRVGVLVEVNCETDFVARTDEFREFVHEIALHVAALKPRFVSSDEVPRGVPRRRAVDLRGPGRGRARARPRAGRRGQAREAPQVHLPPGPGVRPRPGRRSPGRSRRCGRRRRRAWARTSPSGASASSSLASRADPATICGPAGRRATRCSPGWC